MSRAFTKERDDRPDLPEPPVVSHVAGTPVPVTAAGRAELHARLERAQSSAERKHLEGLIPGLVVLEPPADRSVVAFGATVDVHADSLGRRRFRIVGSEEADIAAGSVSEQSPLGSALLGARVGDVVTWRRPIGNLALTIDAIDY